MRKTHSLAEYNEHLCHIAIAPQKEHHVVSSILQTLPKIINGLSCVINELVLDVACLEKKPYPFLCEYVQNYQQIKQKSKKTLYVGSI